MWEKHKGKIIVSAIVILFVLVKFDIVTTNDIRMLVLAIVDIIVGFKNFLIEIGIISPS